MRVLCLSYFLVFSLQPCGHLLRNGWPLGSLVCVFVLGQVWYLIVSILDLCLLDHELLIDPLPPGWILYTMIFWNYTIYKAEWHLLALWRLERYCVTALLTTFPYNSFQSSWANTNLYLILIYQHANDLKITKLNAANSWYASIQLKSIILQIYTLLTFKYTTI